MKLIKRAALILLCAAFIPALAACGGKKAGVGPRLSHNVARFYSPDTRVSRFTIDAEEVAGETKGQAYMSTAARGDTALAWVDTALYFVSREGVDALGTGIGTAEISFDGKKALFLEGDELKLYSLETRSVSVIDSGLEGAVQFAFSPNGESIAFTADYGDDTKPIRTKLYRGGALTELFPDEDVIVLAVSDDAGTIWYYSNETGGLHVLDGGESTFVASCGADANYNFTNDLREAAFNTPDGENHLWRLDTKADALLGSGFDFTLKTDVFSISTVTLFAYINDVDTFTGGLWQKRMKIEGGHLYSVGLIGDDGGIEWLAENADACAAAPDGSRAVWSAGGQLYSTDMEGNNTLLASNADEFLFADDPDTLYFLSGNVLYSVRGTGRPARIDAGVIEMGVAADACVYVREDGALMSVRNGRTQELMRGAARIDMREGQLIAYTDPVSSGDTTLYKAYVSADGVSFTLVGEGVKP